MLSKLDAIAQILEDAAIGTQGETIFVYHMPEQIREGVLLIEDPEGTEIDPDIPQWRKSEFRAIVRGFDYQSAMTVAKQVQSALDLHRLTVGGYQFVRVRTTHEPIPYPVPDSDLIEVSVNLWAVYIEP